MTHSPATNRSQVAVIGAGPIGVEAARALLECAEVDGVSGIVDPDERAREAACAEFSAAGHAWLEDLAPKAGGVAVVAFSSQARAVAPTVVTLLDKGYSVITTCEELAFPAPPVSKLLHQAAQDAGRVVVATGANPGFIMDLLPLTLAQGSREIRRIEVARRVDTQTRRGSLVKKTGEGLTEDEFLRRAESRDIGHVGLEASARLIAQGLGWEPLRVETDCTPIVGEVGHVTGQRQVASLSAGVASIRLVLEMGYGLVDPADEIVIDGLPSIRVIVPGGYPGDSGTVARIVNALQLIPRGAAGFYRPSDTPIHFGLEWR